MKHRIIALLAALMLLFGSACSEAYLPDYISLNDSGETLRYLQDLLGVTEIDRYYQEPFFGQQMLSAVEQFQYEMGLTVTGELDPDTLYALLGLPWMDDYSDPLVWVPMYGGTKYHSKPDCSKMISAQQMPETCAYQLGFDACLRCWR